MGSGTTASGFVSTAMGKSTTAQGDFSTAMGQAITATEDESLAVSGNVHAKNVQLRADSRMVADVRPANTTAMLDAVRQHLAEGSGRVRVRRGRRRRGGRGCSGDSDEADTDATGYHGCGTVEL